MVGRTAEGPHCVIALTRYTGEAEAAREAFAAESTAFALQQPGGTNMQQNQALELLSLADESIAEGLGWAYRLTEAGQSAGALHGTQADRSIDEWNTPDPPPASPTEVPARGD